MNQDDPVETARLALVGARHRFNRLMCGKTEPAEEEYQRAKKELEGAKLAYERLAGVAQVVNP